MAIPITNENGSKTSQCLVLVSLRSRLPMAVRLPTRLALIGWSAPALHLKARDPSIEWSEEQRERRRHLLAQNSRFVVLADRQTFPHLASRAMKLCLQRLSDDWQKQYRHPLLMVESFVDRQLFRATAYKASGWQSLGYSAGFKRRFWGPTAPSRPATALPSASSAPAGRRFMPISPAFSTNRTLRE